MATNECERLTTRFAEMRNQGLVNVKFLLRNTDEAVVEQVCGEVNAMLDAYENGDYEELKFNDSNSHPHT